MRALRSAARPGQRKRPHLQLRMHILRVLHRRHGRALSDLRWGVAATPATKCARRLDSAYGARSGLPLSLNQMRSRGATILLSALLLGAVGALAQNSTLPSGLTQNGSVIMMQPIQDYEGADNGPSISAERHAGRVAFLSAGDHDLYTRAFEEADHGNWLGAARWRDRAMTARPAGDRLALLPRQEQRRQLRRDQRLPEGQSRLARARHALCPRRERARPEHDAAAGHHLVRQPRAGKRHRQDPPRRSDDRCRTRHRRTRARPRGLDQEQLRAAAGAGDRPEGRRAIRAGHGPSKVEQPVLARRHGERPARESPA